VGERQNGFVELQEVQTEVFVVTEAGSFGEPQGGAVGGFVIVTICVDEPQGVAFRFRFCHPPFNYPLWVRPCALHGREVVLGPFQWHLPPDIKRQNNLC